MFTVRDWSHDSAFTWSMCSLKWDLQGQAWQQGEMLPASIYSPTCPTPTNRVPLNAAEIWKTAMQHAMKEWCVFMMKPLGIPHFLLPLLLPPNSQATLHKTDSLWN